MADRFSWFLTSAGRKCSFGLMSAASVAAFGVQYIPHTFMIHKYKEVVSMYESALPVPLNERVRKLWDNTIKDLNIPKHEIKYLEPFTVFGFDLFHAGATISRWGAIIGIPINFTYNDVASINRDPIRVNNEPVNWNRKDAEELVESLVLSENAQRYGIAKEILMVSHNEPLFFSVLGSFMVSSTYLMCRMMNTRFKLLERPLLFRSFFYLVGCVFGYGIWATQKDLLIVMWDRETDKHLAQLNINYSTGAVEFWSQMLKRNRALRTLLGSQGESMYTPTGNEKYFFRQPGIPIDVRKQFFEKNIVERRQGQESLNEDDAIPAPA